MSFTVFLALNSEAFSARWGTPILTLSAYLRFFSAVCLCVTLWLVLVQKERKEVLSKDETSLTSVYKSIWSISQLKSVRSFLIIHLLAKVGFSAHGAATSLKMVEKGLGKEDFAVAVLFDFPIQVVFGYYIARWSRGDRPLHPWIWAFWPRFVFVPCGRYPMEFPFTPDNNGLLHVPSPVPKSRGDSEYYAIRLYRCIPCQGIRPRDRWDLHYTS